MDLTDDQLRCCTFVRIATRLAPHRGSAAPLGEGFHTAHVLLFLPITERQNASLVKLLLDMPKNSYESPGRWVAVEGYMIGILNKDCLAQPPKDFDTTVDIPVVVARDIKWLTSNLLDNREPGAPTVAPPTPPLEERRRRRNKSATLPLSSNASPTALATSAGQTSPQKMGKLPHASPRTSLVSTSI
ncbi:hypothetical protein VFPPC_14926 [Pochonia chlamydosporia 170]|uniref:Uncharacterized protein n=1 Tax=Pochonia chlamydosporia 170 TaxID=1380566 RepID=A0A179F0L7_METCM|nr:hypothetical protein VFPPC_14926 [Pochonia chlamydosporia 170]OAQ59005.1 hypothetical protein VFPPC_14926 [Pochonia chlamydosporia 170]